MKMIFFNFCVLNTDFSFIALNMHTNPLGYLHNIALEGTVSQILDLGPGFIFIR